jgi:DNA-binding IclR family transcriptional regulator
MTQETSKFNAIEKTLEVLLAFTQEKPLWGVRELSQHLAFSPATVQRILQTLKAYGFVVQDSDTRQYTLGSVFYGFYQALSTPGRFSRIARRYMEAVLAETRETVHLNIIQGGDRICVETLESPLTLKAGMSIGSLSPLHAGASAKCLLAFSPQSFQDNYLRSGALVTITDRTITGQDALKQELTAIRMRGYAISIGERTQGLGALSAPILDHSGSVIASMSLAIPEIRFLDPAHLKRCIYSLVRAAGSCSRELGYEGPAGGNTVNP